MLYGEEKTLRALMQKQKWRREKRTILETTYGLE